MTWEAWLGLGSFPTEADALTAGQKAAVTLGVDGVSITEIRRREITADDAAPDFPIATSVAINPGSFGLSVGEFVQLQATTFDQFDQPMGNSDGSNGLPVRSYAWSSTAPSVATVSAGSGNVEGISAGSASIQATDVLSGLSDLTPSVVSVTPQAVASLTASPTTVSATEGTQATITLQPKDGAGNALSGRTVTGSTSNAAIATVSVSGYTGTISLVAAGSASITFTCEGKTVAVPVTVQSASTAHPNEPAGYSRFAEWDCSGAAGTSDLPPTVRALFGTAGGWVCEHSANQSLDGSGKFYLRFPSSLQAGTDPGNLHCSRTASPTSTKRRNYMHWIGFQPGLANGVTFNGTTGDGKYSNHPVDTKMLHFKCNSTPAAASGAAILRLLGQGGTGPALMSSFKIDLISKQTTPNQTYGQNLNPAKLLIAGQPNEVEVVVVMDTGPGNADGEFHAWVNGTKVAEHTNCQFHVAGQANDIYDHWGDNTFGGTRGPSPTFPNDRNRVDYWIWDGFYFSDSD